MKWYTFGGNNDSDKVNLLLDHNTTALVAWNTNNDNTDSSQIDAKVTTDTEGWVGNPRLITAGEVAKITNNPNVQKFKDGTAVSGDYFYFDTNTTSYNPNRGEETSKYAWLFGRTYDCTSYGCDIADNSNYGYWTSMAVSGSSSAVWAVRRNGTLDNSDVSDSVFFGIRPVITISKSNVS